VALQDTKGDGRADKIVRFGPIKADGNAGGTGLAIYNAPIRFGLVVSCARLRFSAAIRSITGGGAAAGCGLMAMPFNLASISCCKAS
jgi:hypothetical protein